MRGKLETIPSTVVPRRLIPAHAGKTRVISRSGSADPAHPRACGENRTRRTQRPAHSGSSPRMRGKPSGTARAVRVVGLIPAHAGKTLQPGHLLLDSRAHPRACGENTSTRFVNASCTGSSPRMRGKRLSRTFAFLGRGLIPAHAGKTGMDAATRRTQRAHPRACGENVQGAWTSVNTTGSSPRMRGKLPLARDFEEGRRLIPAHAGKTERRSPVPVLFRAHPRACGENTVTFGPSGSSPGSSPRMRGKPNLPTPVLAAVGLIPAHAGKTSWSAQPWLSLRAHPRACGENGTLFETQRNKMGSSPRMRGKQTLDHRPVSGVGLIPAHAGKTESGCSCCRRVTAHPRACGENTERSGVLTLRSVRSWKTLSFPSSLKVTHCRTFVQLSLSSIRL